MFKTVRILILLSILAAVAASTALGRWRAQAWDRSQVLTLYPINADGEAATAAYLEQLELSAFADLESYFETQAARHGLALAQPLRIALGRSIARLPPALPQGGGPLAAIAWSLQMRWWAWSQTPPSSPIPDVRLYLLFHTAEGRTGPLPHSTGLQQGRLGLVHLFASQGQQAQNAVVIAHEALHTFGASDKYDPTSLQPVAPDGYADPQRWPLLPQDQAELMAGRIPLSETQAQIPARLAHTVIGPLSAREIGWIKRSP